MYYGDYAVRTESGYSIQNVGVGRKLVPNHSGQHLYMD